MLRQQRLAIVQQFVQLVQSRSTSRPVFRWTSIAEKFQFKCALGPYHGNRVTDFLSVDPVLTKSELHLDFVSSWWRQTWRQWSRQVWPVFDKSWEQLFKSPLWLSKHQALRVVRPHRSDPDNTTSHCVGMCTKTHRPFRRWYAQASQRSRLQDFVTTDGSWPSEDQFSTHVNQLLSRHALSELDQYIELLPVRPKIK